MEQNLLMAVDEAQAKGGVVMILFMFVMVLLVWCLIMFNHIKKGWGTLQRIFDIIITLLILAAIALMAFPLVR